MDLLETIEILENTTGLERTVVATKTGEEIISYISTTNNTFTVNLDTETLVDNVFRVCLRSISDTLYLYVTHRTRNHYTKFDLTDVEELEVLC